MAGSDRGWSACLATRLPVVLIAVASCCLMGIAQAGADTGTVRVEVLHNGRNISEGCLGTLANAQTGELVFLVPEGGALVARVPAGLYSGTVFSAEDHSLPPQILLVTVAAGETVTKTVALGQSPGGALWPGQAGSDDGETGGADESQPGTPGSGPGGEGAPGGEDDGDGDETRPRDDDEGDPRAGRVVIGEIVFSWSAVCRAEESTYTRRPKMRSMSPFSKKRLHRGLARRSSTLEPSAILSTALSTVQLTMARAPARSLSQAEDCSKSRVEQYSGPVASVKRL